MMASFVSCLPIHAPHAFFSAVEVLRAFTHCNTPLNPSAPQYSSLAAKFHLSIGVGELIGAELALSTSGLSTERGLLKVPHESGHRAFDVFYYLNASSAPEAEREALQAQPPSAYALLQKSGTFGPPSYIETSDDAAAADDFRRNLNAIGIQGIPLMQLYLALSGLLKLGQTLGDSFDDLALDEFCKDAAQLLDVDYRVLRFKCDSTEREVLLGGIYEAIVDWVIVRANETIREELRAAKALAQEHSAGGEEDEDSVCISVVDMPGQQLGKAVALRTIFDDSEGINAEMKDDGVPVSAAGTSVLKEMQSAVSLCEPELGIMDGPSGREREHVRDTKEGILEKVGQECDDTSFLKELLHPVQGQGVVLGAAGRFNLAHTINSSRVWFHLSLHPSDEGPAAVMLANNNNPWSAAVVSRQLREWRLPEWANRRNKSLDFTADFELAEFVERYGRLGCGEGKEGVDAWRLERGWSNGEVVIGDERVWMREAAWWEAEGMLEVLPPLQDNTLGASGMESGYSVQTPGTGNPFFSAEDTPAGSNDNLLQRHQSTYTLGDKSRISLAPSAMQTNRNVSGGDYGLGGKGDTYKGQIQYDGEIYGELADGKHLIEQPTSFKRRLWVGVVWALTFWIPSPLLKYVGRMKRPDVRMAWREKLVLIFFIFLLNAFIVFYIIEFGRLLCPNFDKAWNTKEVSENQGTSDFYVSHKGFVYDITKFAKIDHSDLTGVTADAAAMLPFAGTNVDELIQPPLTIACPHLVTNTRVILTANISSTVSNSAAIHNSGPAYQPATTTALNKIDWYTTTFIPKIKEYFKGDLVWTASTIKSQGENEGRMWFTIGKSVYDMTDYFYNLNTVHKGDTAYAFFPSLVVEAIEGNPGGDMTSAFAKLNSTIMDPTLQCLNNYFYTGQVDFRTTVKCQINNYILLAFTIILCAVILVKFLAALQLGSKRRPAQQEKFVICQVPAYTEGEDQLRKGLDSLTALAYDNKRKLICVICDGMIVGGGNDRPTPKIVLDILGVDPKIDPPALPFKSVGAGSEQLNYGKVYSGLYEYEGNVVPYIVVVKVGKESEQGKTKPGNRGKRDSQILLMSFLNRVHHRSAMSPLELEMFHQINNIIGVDPELYEYVFMVDADTSVKEDSLNRLVAACANDAKIAGICGETSLENEERSWWTMIQVYEYYISHHLAKAFESLFGSVTCLPGW
jgi:chitin synthase